MVAAIRELTRTLLFCGVTVYPMMTFAQGVEVLPARLTEGAQSLDGEWQFKYIPSSDVGADDSFFKPSFDSAGWKRIPVPSHWELLGFAEPEYGDDVKEGTGLYRRLFCVEKPWQGERVYLRFEGVLYGLTAWVNGKPVGEWASSYNPVTFDITEALSPGVSTNVLAVRVTTRCKGWNFDNMDCWALSGIYRRVSLFVLPQLHFNDYTATTTLKPDGAAECRIAVRTSGGEMVSGRLLSPAGKLEKAFEFKLSQEGQGSAAVTLSQPELWTAETPALYRLELDLHCGGRAIQRLTDRIGLRQVTIEDGLLKVNGTPVKLRGINHHDIWPEGRVTTDKKMRRDLELIRDANINFIRTSHYPPCPGFIEMCDEMGFYVDCEVPYIHGRSDLKNPDFQSNLLTRARATVLRDKNRCSVIVWSLGNENPMTRLGNNTGNYVREIDPTRPILFPMKGSDFDTHFRNNFNHYPDCAEIYAPHYPAVKRAKEYAEKISRPIIFTEYAHQRGLARAGTGVQDLWDVFYRSKHIAGGALWVFQDQGILRTAEEVKRVKDGDLMVWLDERRYYDTHGFHAMDGIVYSDRTPQVDYWQVKKVYSPVQIAEREWRAHPGSMTLMLPVENRYDFRSLRGINLHWSLQRNGVSIQRGTVALSAKPKTTEDVSLALEFPSALKTDIFTVCVQCDDEHGRCVYDRQLRLETGVADDARWSALMASLPRATAKLDISESVLEVRQGRYQLRLNRQTGGLSLLGLDGTAIISSFGPHVGRHPTINDMGKDREREPALWRGSLLSEVTELKTSARQSPEGIEISVEGNYPRPGKPEESIRGGYTLLVLPTGAMRVNYHYVPMKATGEMLEAGFALEVAKAHAECRWVGEGPFAGYAGKDRLNEYGIFQLNRDSLYFPGNRRRVELASLSAPSGAGVLIAGTAMIVDLERAESATFLSHLAQAPGGLSTPEGKGENVDVSSRLKAGSVKSIEGSFNLLPLAAPWQPPLTEWLGATEKPASSPERFFRSYDE